jgi:hypothetical protein
MEFAGGHRYEGMFKDVKQHGHGVMEFAGGNRYEGQHKDGKVHGHGVWEYAGGDRYEGQHKDGLPHGRSILVESGGDRFTTLWENGKLVNMEELQSRMDDLTLEQLLKHSESIVQERYQ